MVWLDVEKIKSNGRPKLEWPYTYPNQRAEAWEGRWGISNIERPKCPWVSLANYDVTIIGWFLFTQFQTIFFLQKMKNSKSHAAIMGVVEVGNGMMMWQKIASFFFFLFSKLNSAKRRRLIFGDFFLPEFKHILILIIVTTHYYLPLGNYKHTSKV